MKISEKIINLSARLLLAADKKEIIEISSELNDLAQIALPENDFESEQTGFLKFTKKEISKMPKKTREIFLSNGAVAHVRKRKSGAYTYCYDIRWRKNGYDICASSTDLETAKERFITAFTNTMQGEPIPTKQLTFDKIAEEWFSCRKGRITAETYKHYYSYYTRYIYPLLAGKNIRNIRSAELMKILQQVDDKKRACEDIRSILNQIFNYAYYNGLITHNPVKLIEFIKYQRTTRTALTDNEIRYFVAKLNEPEFAEYRTELLLELYFGLRPCEVETARIDGDFLIARNAKRKKGRIEYKRIPFSRMAKESITSIPPVLRKTERLNQIFKRIFPDKTQYVLRHTFATKCQEFVRQEIVDIWLGDNSERLIGQTYTHFSDAFMLSEMAKVKY